MGALKVREFPSNSFSPADLSRVIQSYKAKSITFDLVVIDYLDIMRPNDRNRDSRENSRMIWIDSRAIAQREGFAMLSATQTNREGFMSDTAGMEHVADDINKMRTVDLGISINFTEEERRKGEARLYFAASRNQEAAFSVHVRQDLSRMKFVTDVLAVS
jgi:replicative DNA helicase